MEDTGVARPLTVLLWSFKPRVFFTPADAFGVPPPSPRDDDGLALLTTDCLVSYNVGISRLNLLLIALFIAMIPYYFLTNLASVFLPEGAPCPTSYYALSPSLKAYPAPVDLIFSRIKSMIFFWPAPLIDIL